MTYFLEWLDQWQTLLGSILGGVIALCAALIVAQAQTRRERRAAATIILSDLFSVFRTFRNLRTAAAASHVDEKEYPLWLTERLLWRRPKLSSHFEAEMVRVVDVHTSLAAHLSLFKISFTIAEDGISQLEECDARPTEVETQASLTSAQQILLGASAVAEEYERAAGHAECAIHFLEKLVLSRTPSSVAKLRMKLWSCEVERKSDGMLESK